MGYLMRRNILAYKAPPNNEGYDLICIHPNPRHKPQGDEAAQVRVQVKSRYATDCDRGYLLESGEFLLDPRRLTVALSRAKRKMILVASRSIFSLFSPEEDVFANSLLWKNLLLRTCTALLWQGERGGTRVAVWGGSGGGENQV